MDIHGALRAGFARQFRHSDTNRDGVLTTEDHRFPAPMITDSYVRDYDRDGDRRVTEQEFVETQMEKARNPIKAFFDGLASL